MWVRMIFLTMSVTLVSSSRPFAYYSGPPEIEKESWGAYRDLDDHDCSFMKIDLPDETWQEILRVYAESIPAFHNMGGLKSVQVSSAAGTKYTNKDGASTNNKDGPPHSSESSIDIPKRRPEFFYYKGMLETTAETKMYVRNSTNGNKEDGKREETSDEKTEETKNLPIFIDVLNSLNDSEVIYRYLVGILNRMRFPQADESVYDKKTSSALQSSDNDDNMIPKTYAAILSDPASLCPVDGLEKAFLKSGCPLGALATAIQRVLCRMGFILRSEIQGMGKDQKYKKLEHAWKHLDSYHVLMKRVTLESLLGSKWKIPRRLAMLEFLFSAMQDMEAMETAGATAKDPTTSSNNIQSCTTRSFFSLKSCSTFWTEKVQVVLNRGLNQELDNTDDTRVENKKVSKDKIDSLPIWNENSLGGRFGQRRLGIPMHAVYRDLFRGPHRSWADMPARHDEMTTRRNIKNGRYFLQTDEIVPKKLKEIDNELILLKENRKEIENEDRKITLELSRQVLSLYWCILALTIQLASGTMFDYEHLAPMINGLLASKFLPFSSIVFSELHIWTMLSGLDVLQWHRFSWLRGIWYQDLINPKPFLSMESEEEIKEKFNLMIFEEEKKYMEVKQVVNKKIDSTNSFLSSDSFLSDSFLSPDMLVDSSNSVIFPNRRSWVVRHYHVNLLWQINKWLKETRFRRGVDVVYFSFLFGSFADLSGKFLEYVLQSGITHFLFLSTAEEEHDGKGPDDKSTIPMTAQKYCLKIQGRIVNKIRKTKSDFKTKIDSTITSSTTTNNSSLLVPPQQIPPQLATTSSKNLTSSSGHNKIKYRLNYKHFRNLNLKCLTMPFDGTPSLPIDGAMAGKNLPALLLMRLGVDFVVTDTDILYLNSPTPLLSNLIYDGLRHEEKKIHYLTEEFFHHYPQLRRTNLEVRQQVEGSTKRSFSGIEWYPADVRGPINDNRATEQIRALKLGKPIVTKTSTSSSVNNESWNFQVKLLGKIEPMTIAYNKKMLDIDDNTVISSGGSEDGVVMGRLSVVSEAKSRAEKGPVVEAGSQESSPQKFSTIDEEVAYNREVYYSRRDSIYQNEVYNGIIRRAGSSAARIAKDGTTLPKAHHPPPHAYYDFAFTEHWDSIAVNNGFFYVRHSAQTVKTMLEYMRWMHFLPIGHDQTGFDAWICGHEHAEPCSPEFNWMKNRTITVKNGEEDTNIVKTFINQAGKGESVINEGVVKRSRWADDAKESTRNAPDGRVLRSGESKAKSTKPVSGIQSLRNNRCPRIFSMNQNVFGAGSGVSQATSTLIGEQIDSKQSFEAIQQDFEPFIFHLTSSDLPEKLNRIRNMMKNDDAWPSVAKPWRFWWERIREKTKKLSLPLPNFRTVLLFDGEPDFKGWDLLLIMGLQKKIVELFAKEESGFVVTKEVNSSFSERIHQETWRILAPIGNMMQAAANNGKKKLYFKQTLSNTDRSNVNACRNWWPSQKEYWRRGDGMKGEGGTTLVSNSTLEDSALLEELVKNYFIPSLTGPS